MQDTKHTFNVIFKSENRKIQNLSVFHIYPIYWVTETITGNGIAQGNIAVYALGHDVLSNPIDFSIECSAFALPRMDYSASVVLSGCSIFTACAVVLEFESGVTPAY